MRRKFFILLLSCVALTFAAVGAKEKQRAFSREKSEQFLQDGYYSYDDNPVNSSSDSWLARAFRKIFRGVAENTHIKAPNEIVLYLLGAILLYIILKNTRFSWKHLLPDRKSKSPSAAEWHENGETIDFLSLATRSEAEKMYTLAFHYRFLHLMISLESAGVINIKDNLTNWEYVRLIKDASIRNRFTSVVTVYDRIWYGEYEVPESRYRDISAEIVEINRMLK
ncbi:hypothetical protein SDC9_61483 [bioreactor metagenome]|uniref:Protein-glutamine gamma-glutamyltransferase-like C-terminal domain-containing protein n=1 Tax=bioreactor metagenome TaxID=1076179 RepID=A0A644XGS3_9ZZZZ